MKYALTDWRNHANIGMWHREETQMDWRFPLMRACFSGSDEVGFALYLAQLGEKSPKEMR
jgi:hypothetical protein